ncbi:DUF4112 domain-containing protein [Cognatiyoonia sp. IB215182]|uniref:DUF4112 domain-containing protein n=1 Tax=Cognatiyoonia sp. IB215182 TaxID=3097353 RepID=UPI002A132270|nr:DUF4112 domain-containing protein [Cognatiyoonia sp. IB215182]MDX8352089.1 DUF4112 domain-containing protein [Cognatiyoonia sp. IB215182]
MNIEQDIDFELDRLRKLAFRMDALVTIPGTRICIGFDNLIGLMPVVGDLLTALPGLWTINQARRLGASPGTLAYMVLNTAFDTAIGMFPVVGDVFDVFYCANIRNYRALERNLNKKVARAKTVRTTHDPVRWAKPTLIG